jgi:hypothetical protein
MRALGGTPPASHGLWAREGAGLAEGDRVRTSRSNPFGISQAEAFGNSLEDSVSFRFPTWLNLDGSPLLR